LLKRSSDPHVFLEQLRDAERWKSQRVPAQRATCSAQRLRVRTADWRTPIDDTFQSDVERFGTVPLDAYVEDGEATERDKETGRKGDKEQAGRLQQVQYISSGGYGSNGGGGRYRIVVMNGGGYEANGSAYRGGYGSNGGPGGYGSYYAPAVFNRPRVYNQPVYQNGNYGGGRFLVCGPWGCLLQ
jgi:hypothetical protein